MQKGPSFIEKIIEGDIKRGFSKNKLCFRFPPEPNGFLHIGHVKAICLNFDLGEEFGAPVNLRFDDTNPSSEKKIYVEGIKEDILWLGYKWHKECYASDYFEQLYLWAEELISKDRAYVDSQDSETIASQKGTPTKPGKESPYRSRSKEENLSLFSKMRAGKFEEGEHVLRAKISMSSPNMLLRDPVMYRIIKKSHQRTLKKWCIYPMYDWAHGQSDYIEKISHSLCTLEFKPHRDLYEWFLYALGPNLENVPKQREFARLNLSHTITSKRKLKRLIDEGHVNGWDDPRMPTISGLRKRGYTPESLKKFVRTAGVAKRENIIELSLLEFCIREHLNKISPRIMAVLDPIKIIIENYPEGKEEQLIGEINPEDPSEGTRKIPFSKELFIEKEDFQEQTGESFFRLSLGNEVRLKNAYIIKAKEVIRDEEGNIKHI
ncbi:MAG: glutamine--tRNA ligase, partial [Flavobacteriaceae bacterium]|nr:glutamine--tRNA ligase [Flavobacteriaceae bacterium]